MVPSLDAGSTLRETARSTSPAVVRREQSSVAWKCSDRQRARQSDVVRAVANVAWHIDVRCIAFCNRRQNAIGELVIGTIPRAMITSDRTVF
jgi:hypothetical protein